MLTVGEWELVLEALQDSLQDVNTQIAKIDPSLPQADNTEYNKLNDEKGVYEKLIDKISNFEVNGRGVI